MEDFSAFLIIKQKTDFSRTCLRLQLKKLPRVEKIFPTLKKMELEFLKGGSNLTPPWCSKG